MGLRWYTTVIDANDVTALSAWWAETLNYQYAFQSDDEAVLVPSHVDEELIRSTPWDQVGPGLVFVRVDGPKPTKNRIHVDLAPHTSDDRDALIEALVSRGARAVDVGQPADASWTVLTDPEGNEFCVLSARDM